MAHRGIAVADMPNLFFLLGPNTGLGHNVRGVHDRVADPLRGEAITAVDQVRGAGVDAQSRGAGSISTRNCKRDLARSVWNTGGCRSWYLDEHGVNRSLWSGMAWEYWRRPAHSSRRSTNSSGLAARCRRVCWRSRKRRSTTTRSDCTLGVHRGGDATRDHKMSISRLVGPQG